MFVIKYLECLYPLPSFCLFSRLSQNPTDFSKIQIINLFKSLLNKNKISNTDFFLF